MAAGSDVRRSLQNQENAQPGASLENYNHGSHWQGPEFSRCKCNSFTVRVNFGH